MGKRKQRKTQEEHKTKKSPSNDNQENQSLHVNYQTPSKRDLNQPIAKPQIKGNASISIGQQNVQQVVVSQTVEEVNRGHSNKKSEQKQHQELQSKVSAPSCEEQAQSLRKIQFPSDEKDVPQKGGNNSSIATNKQQRLNPVQNISNDWASVTLESGNGGKVQKGQNVQTSQLQRNEQNSFMLALDSTKKVLFISHNQIQQEYLIEAGFDSGQDDEDYGDEEEDEQILNQIYQSQGNGQALRNYNYGYDEVEPTQYNTKQDHKNPQQSHLSKTYNDPNNKQLARDIQQLSMETFIQGDEQIQSDIKFCLYCIYNNHDISSYFKQLLRLQRRLKEWSFQIQPNTLFNIFEENIKEFMHGIRDKVIEEMRALRMIRQKPSQKRYSFDDYFLIDKTFSRSYSLHGYNNEILNHCMKYMLDSKYESIRNDLRYRIWSEMRKNNEILVSFYQQPDSYQKVFDLIIKFYTRVRDSVIGIEEIWMFLMESVFQQELKGNMIFEQFHKQIFNKDILGHRYIQGFLKQINDVRVDFENRKQNNQQTNLDPIIDNISQILFELEEDLNFQYPDETDSQDQTKPKEQDTKVTQDQQNVDNIEVDDYDYGDQELIITYQQLQDKMKLQYGGLTLAQQVEQYSTQSNNSMSILKAIQQDKKWQDLMKNLPNLDTDTLCYVIENKLTRQDYESIMSQIQTKLGSSGDFSLPNSGHNDTKDDSTQDDIIISPSKNLNFLNQYFSNVSNDIYNDQQNNSISDDDEEDKQEKQNEKKKKKNKKKKRKRKEKKILAQHQNQLEEMLKSKIIEEQQKRFFEKDEDRRNELRKLLIKNLGAQADIFLDGVDNVNNKDKERYSQQAMQNPKELRLQDNDNDSTTDMELQDPQFEKELEQFRERLESSMPTNNKHMRALPKLRPNIPEDWIMQLRERLKNYYNFKSPKQGGMVTMKMDYNNLPEGLWMKAHQHSA